MHHSNSVLKERHTFCDNFSVSMFPKVLRNIKTDCLLSVTAQTILPKTIFLNLDRLFIEGGFIGLELAIILP